MFHSYQWRRCDAAGENCADISGATDATYVVTADDLASTLRVAVTATNGGGSATALSAVTEAATSPSLTAIDSPTISQTTTADGDALVADPGSWSGAGPISYAYRWQRCESAGTGCVNIVGATESVYVLDGPDVGASLRVLVIASNANGSETAKSDPTAAIEESEPENIAAPSTAGSAVANGELSAQPGTWSGSHPMDYEFQWERCDGAGDNCSDIEDESEAFYDPVAGDVGLTLRVRVIASNSVGSDNATSAPTAPVIAEATLATSVAPSISGTPLSGEDLTAAPGTWSGTGTVSFSYQWMQCDPGRVFCAEIDGASDAVYEARPEDVGSALAVVVTATDDNEQMQGVAYSSQIRATGAPADSAAPAVTGAGRVGEELSASTGSWSGTGPFTYGYQWQRCFSEDACEEIDEATDDAYTVTEDDLGAAVRVAVTATNASGSTTSVSAATAEVTPPTPYLTAAPTISGDAREGETLTADEGNWVGDGSISYDYQWQRCDATGEGCDDISGATANTYAPDATDVGATVRVQVTATDSTRATTSPSSVTDPVADALSPVNTAAPAVSGLAEVGETLTAGNGTWTGAGPIEYSYQWQACDGEGAGCADIDGATASSFEVSEDERAATVRLVVVASNASGSARAASDVTDAIGGPLPPTSGSFRNTVAPSISGDAAQSELLIADEGEWTSPGAIAYEYQWRRCDSDGDDCENVEGATGSTYAPGAGDLGSTLRVSVVATSGRVRKRVASDPTEAVGPGAPANYEAPSFEGDATAGSSLSASPGSWSGDPSSFAYQWQRCDASGDDCAAIPEETYETYWLSVDDIGATVRVVVTATNDTGSRTAPSVASEVVDGGPPAPPVNDWLPSVYGEFYDGQTLYANPGAWSGQQPMNYGLQWRRCDAAGDDCEDIDGATGWEYTAGSGDVGSTLRLSVEATNPTDSQSAVSDPSPVIASAAPSNTYEPWISGLRWEGQTVTADPGNWTGSKPQTFEYQWRRCAEAGDECEDILGATEQAYTLAETDVGATLRVSVTATNPQGSADAISYPFGPIGESGPTNLTLPTISGTAELGAWLFPNVGSWSGEPESYTVQWRRCDTAGENCVDIDDATSWVYEPVLADLGKRLVVVVTVHAGEEYTASATSSPTAVIGLGNLTAYEPENLVAPSFTGEAEKGATLSADAGLWNGRRPLDYLYRWERCTSTTSCSLISGATGTSYEIGDTDVGKRIRLTVYAQNGWGTVMARTETSDVVTEAPTTNVSPPTMSGDAVIGAPMTVEPGEWSQPVETWVAQWQRCDTEGEQCEDIVAADSWGQGPYKPTLADLGATLRARVIVNGGGDATATTEPSGVIGEAEAPEATEAPTITGTAEAGQMLEVDPGTWAGSPDISFDYQWLRCNSEGSSCSEISGERAGGYRVKRADIASTLVVSATATNGAGSVSVGTEPTSVVPEPPALANVEAPQIDAWASLEYGETVSITPGVWAGEPELTYEWQRCDPLTEDPETSEMDCEDIAGAPNTGNYTPTAEDVGFRLRLAETATTPTDSETMLSEPSEVQVVQRTDDDDGSYEGVVMTGKTIIADSTVTSEAALPITTEYRFTRVEFPPWGDQTVVQDGGDPSYTLTNDDIDSTIHIEMTSTVWRADEQTPVDTREVDVWTSTVDPLPNNTTPPSISGTTTVGSRLTVDRGSWAGGGGELDYRYQWQRCDDEGDNCEDITSADAVQYVASSDDSGSTLRVRVTATGGGESDDATSTPSDIIASATAPVNTEAPTISGDAVELTPLTAVPGTWTGSDPRSYDYQWQVCSATGAGCASIAAATAVTYTPDALDIGRRLRLRVAATNAAGRVVTTSAPTAVIRPAPAPENTVLPVVSILGRPEAGSTAVAAADTWTSSYEYARTYDWQRCNVLGEDCQSIPGANYHGYSITAADAGSRLRVEISSRNGSGRSASAVSAPSPPIGYGTETALGRLAYVAQDQKTLHLVDTDGSDDEQVTSCAELGFTSDGCDLSGPRISPNGKQIVFALAGASGGSARSVVATVNIDGSGKRLFQAADEDRSQPTWSADSTQIIYTGSSGGSTWLRQIPAYAAGDQSPRTLPTMGDNPGEADVSVSGEFMVYTADVGDNERALFIRDPDGAERVEIDADDADRVYRPRISEDDSEIVFTAGSDGSTDDAGVKTQAWTVDVVPRDRASAKAAPSSRKVGNPRRVTRRNSHIAVALRIGDLLFAPVQTYVVTFWGGGITKDLGDAKMCMVGAGASVFIAPICLKDLLGGISDFDYGRRGGGRFGLPGILDLFGRGSGIAIPGGEAGGRGGSLLAGAAAVAIAAMAAAERCEELNELSGDTGCFPDGEIRTICHHIVGWRKKRPDREARVLLLANGINPYGEPANLVEITERYHKVLEKKGYWAAIDAAIAAADDVGSATGIGSKNVILATLRVLGVAIVVADPGWPWVEKVGRCNEYRNKPLPVSELPGPAA